MPKTLEDRATVISKRQAFWNFDGVPAHLARYTLPAERPAGTKEAQANGCDVLAGTSPCTSLSVRQEKLQHEHKHYCWGQRDESGSFHSLDWATRQATRSRSCRLVCGLVCGRGRCGRGRRRDIKGRRARQRRCPPFCQTSITTNPHRRHPLRTLTSKHTPASSSRHHPGSHHTRNILLSVHHEHKPLTQTLSTASSK